MGHGKVDQYVRRPFYRMMIDLFASFRRQDQNFGIAQIFKMLTLCIHPIQAYYRFFMNTHANRKISIPAYALPESEEFIHSFSVVDLRFHFKRGFLSEIINATPPLEF